MIKCGAENDFFCYDLLKFFICCSESVLKEEQNVRHVLRSISVSTRSLSNGSLLDPCS